jgi:ribosomal protein S27AE
MPNSKCLRCGSELLADGALYGPSRLALRPEDAKFLTMEIGHVMTKATMCRECGFVEIVGDVQKLRRLTGYAAPEAEPAP